MKKYLLGVDNGGTYIKAAIYDKKGKRLGIARQYNEVLKPKPGRTEYDQEKLWEINCNCIKNVITETGVDPNEIACIGIAGQGCGFYAVDRFGKSIRNAITSADTRAEEIVEQWKKDGTGILSTNYAEGGAFYSATDKTPKDWPDTQLHFVISRVINHGRELKWGYGVSVPSCYLRPESRGTVRLASTDPSAAPLIDPNYLSDEKDIEFMVAGAERARAIMEEAPLAKFITEDYAAPYIEKDGMIGYIRNKSDTIYHPVGTCRMGSDELSVVDTDLKVRGIEGLRIIDASVMPTLISANTNAPTIAIAEKIADQMKSEHNTSAEVPTEINNYAKAEHVAAM